MASESATIEKHFPVADYNLAVTLASGQAFRWSLKPDGWWEGVVHGRCLRLRQTETGLLARLVRPAQDWLWLEHYLQTELDLQTVLATFPRNDIALQTAVASCRGLRLLRQNPWECLASFILSSTKQICQIEQCVELISRSLGQKLESFDPAGEKFGFPDAATVAAGGEELLRACKTGFRAKYLFGSARMIAAGEVDLASLASMTLEEARDQLTRLPGVGPKIADCVLLFAYGFPRAFPVDVWVERVVRECYFNGRPVKRDRLVAFVENHFGQRAGYAQQYLFHHRRMLGKIPAAADTKPAAKRRGIAS